MDLEKDPTPGDPHRVRNLAKNLHDFADDVSKVLRDIKGMAGEDAILTWAGKTAESFTSEFEDAPGKLKKLKKSYEMAGDALSTYWPELERAQALADKALVKGREAQGDLSSAQTRLTSADSWMDKAGKEADKYKDDKDSGKDVPKPDPDKVKAATRNANSAEKAQSAAKSDVSAAKSNLDAAKKMAEDARKMREDAAGTAKKKLEDASDAGIQNRKWWEEVGDWVTDNWDTIVAVCKVVVAVLGIIAMIIGGPILGAIVLIAALVVLADTLNKYANGEAGLLDVAFAALDCIPGMKGLTSLRGLAKGLKGLKSGLKGLKSARSALNGVAKGSYDRLKTLVKGCGDPVDAATGYMFLEATDISLPGTLPFAFIRRNSSGYRTGWWFGPTWASTIDQRLEVDEQGIVFVTEDGMLLAYPHPEGPGSPVLPESGPRWPLVQADNGGYLITNPVIGHNRHFAPPTEGLALLSRVSDRNHNTIDFDYDAEGTPLAIRHSGGYSLKLTVNDGRVTALSMDGALSGGSRMAVKQYDYTDGDLTAVTNSSGLSLKFTYDEQMRITSWEDTNHSRYEYAYDAQNRCTAQGGAAGHLANSFAYELTDPAWPDCRITEVTTSEGSASRIVINDRCLVVAEVDPLGGIFTTAYDNNQYVCATTDQVGHTTRVVNNELGQPTEVTRPDGAVVRVTYNNLNLPTAIEQPDGTTWSHTYDERGNCTSTTDPAGVTARTTYTATGSPATVTNLLGHTTQVRCSPAGLPAEVANPFGGVTTWEHDALGRPIVITNMLGQTTQLGWSTEGQLLHRVAADSTHEEWTYDGEGNCTSYTDQLGQVTRFEYTHFDLLASRTGPDNARYAFTHDASLRLTQVINPQGLMWDYIYDAAGNLVGEADFDNRTVTYTRDASGQITSRANHLGQDIRFEHDELGHIIRKESAGVVTTFEYDLLGNLTRADSQGSSIVLERDRLGQLIAETVDDRTIAYTYDEFGRRTSRTTPSGATSMWQYDEMGQISRLTASGRSIDFDRDLAGQQLGLRFGNGIALSNSFDETGRLTSQAIKAVDGNTVQRRSYRYRADGNLTGIMDHLSGPQQFDLDAAGRVTAVHARDWHEAYAYDASGNQTHSHSPITHPGHEANGPRVYTGTQLTRAGNVRYEHDRLGRTTLRQKTRLSRKPDTWHYEWDTEDRLASVITPDGTRWHYRYDPLGRRIAKQRLTPEGEAIIEQTVFIWDGTTMCEQTSVSPALPRPITLTWDYQGNTPISQTERIATDTPQEEIDSRFFSIVTDLVGTPTEMIDENGDIAWRSRSTLWGTTAWNTNSSTYIPLRFPGQYFDPETELHYNYFRHYDPETSRYLTQDPLGLGPADNPSTYVHNPHTWVDPLGLAGCKPSLGERLKGLFGGGRTSDSPAVPDTAPAEPPRMLNPAPPGMGSPATLYGPFHRLSSPTQTREVTDQVIQSGELWGRTSRFGGDEMVQAHVGPLPENARPGSFEFYTSVAPKPAKNSPPGYAGWELGKQPGVQHAQSNGEDFARIPVFVTQVR
ncbi:DUF6531 domain-containing protein [Streptomyces sp. NPDC047525]|uniref:DUF6531 domain-containing protein n=1 Tax=Streptomyces sp. NPDC047525 TaxID=3155264 RepID=UPI0033ED93FD